MKRIFVIAVAIMILCLCSCGVVIDEKEENYAGSVTLRVHCETVMEKGASSEDYPGIPVVFDGKVSFSEDDTAFDVIDRTLKEKKIHIEFEDSSYGKYIKGLANIYAGDFGDMSGWLFKVNGDFAEVSCSAYKLSDGDDIELVYSCEMGDVD